MKTAILSCLFGVLLLSGALAAPLFDMFEGRNLFEFIMGEYRYRKADGWAHTADIAENFKGVDFYKGTEIDGVINAQIAVSMKTTTLTNVNTWLNSKPIQDNIKFLKEGIEKGFQSHKKFINIKKAEIHIYVPKENIHIKDDWMEILKTMHPDIEFNINVLEDFVN